MSDSEDIPTKGPPPNETTDDTEAQETDTQPQKTRSRSQSRRARRRKQQQSQTPLQKQKQKQKEMLPVHEAESEEEVEEEENAAQAQAGAMQPFQHIGPDSTSMDGPVTYARAQRGEIPMRPGNPRQSLKTGNPNFPAPEDYAGGAVQQPKSGGGESDLMKQDGLKLRLELNLELEIVRLSSSAKNSGVLFHGRVVVQGVGVGRRFWLIWGEFLGVESEDMWRFDVGAVVSETRSLSYTTTSLLNSYDGLLVTFDMLCCMSSLHCPLATLEFLPLPLV